jgi:hypothetical protein
MGSQRQTHFSGGFGVKMAQQSNIWSMNKEQNMGSFLE